MTDSTADFTDEQISSMNPTVLEQEISNAVDERYGTPQQDSQNYEQQQPQEGEQGQQQYVDPQVMEDTYKQIFAPFKAAGKEFQVRNINEAISLMQKGVDYTRKQQALKPRLMEMRALEEQGMLGSNLNYAIDLFKGNPQAIAKLIKEKNIDINQIVPQQTTNEFGETVTQPETPYTPNDYSVSAEKYALSEVLDDLKASNKMQTVMDALKGFDQDSLTEFAKEPKYLHALSNLIDTGAYADIRAELDRARTVDDPEIRGMNDFQAMNVIGSRFISAAQMYMNQQQPQSVQQSQYEPPQVNPQQQQYAQQRQIVDQRKQGVAPIRQGSAPQKPNYDPLYANLSDEEFGKLNLNDILRM